MNSTVTNKVIEQIAAAKNVDPLELPPLHSAIDPDALNALIETSSTAEVTFRYAGREITVQNDETIELRGSSQLQDGTPLYADDD